MSSFILRLQYRAIQNKVASVSMPRINWKVIYFLATVVCCVMLVFYVFLVNQLVGGAYAIKDYNMQITALVLENRDLQAYFAESSFLGGIQEKAQQFSFEKTTNVKYLQILQSALAEAK